MLALRLLRFLLAPLVAAFAAPYTAAQDCVVVEAGLAKATVVVEEGLSSRIGEALGDFQEFVQRMSGARLEVSPAPWPGLAALRLQVGAEGLPAEDRKALQALNVEGFVLRVRDGQAWVCGASDLGVQHGLYWLLEQWGCRWLFPGADGEVVPEGPTLIARRDFQTAQQPFFLMRYIWYNFGNLLTPQIRKDLATWERRNRLAYSLRGSVGHAYDRFVPRKDDKLFREHPEFFPMKAGERVRNGQICTCNPGVRERAVQYAREYFRANPAAAIVSMSPNDGGGAWRCPGCRGFRTFTDAALSLANHVADAVKNEPATRDKLVGMYAYFDTAFPPSLAARDNVIVFLATRLTVLPWTWLAPSWRKKATHLGIRDYASVLAWSWTQPVWGLEKLQKKVRLWRDLRVEAVSVESGNDWGGWGLYHYVLARLLWDPGEDVKQVVGDYCEKGYGEAAPAMRRYFERWKCAYSPGLRAAASRDLAAAWRAEPAAEVRRRVERLVVYLEHLRLLDAYRSARSTADRVRALEPLVVFDWRAAPLGIAHTLPLVDVYLRRDAVRSLGVAPNDFDGWRDARSFSPEELRGLAEQLPR